jgi:rhodanese-related sulfurtransferase
MKTTSNNRSRKFAIVAAVSAFFTVAIVGILLSATGLAARRQTAAQQEAHPAHPPQGAQGAQGAPGQRPTSTSIEPAELAKELAGNNKPIIVCVGPHALYEGAHIPGASFHGAASSSDGLDDLKKWAKDIPKTSNIVLYCGCCPLTQCPNVRPALQAMRAMGFTNVQVLRLATDFNTDWITKNYPVEKGK